MKEWSERPCRSGDVREAGRQTERTWKRRERREAKKEQEAGRSEPCLAGTLKGHTCGVAGGGKASGDSDEGTAWTAEASCCQRGS